jgi:hypothetical protein
MNTVYELERRRKQALRAAEREYAGPYGLLVAALENAETHLRESGLGAKIGHSTSSGTRGQDLILLEAARLVVRNPNGATERFSCLLRAFAEETGRRDAGEPILARRSFYANGELREVRPADHWAERADAFARKLVTEGDRS